jgi:integration host factor subunit alpha
MNKKTLTRADLSESLHRNIGLSRTESADMVNSVLDLISDALVDGQSVKLSSFGTFMVRSKRERMGRNPKTGEEVPITPRRVLVFRPSQVMKNVVNGLEGGDED